MPFYDNNLNYNRNFKKEFQYDNLKQRSSGLGFFVFAYSLTMTVSAMIVVEVFKAFGSAKYIYSDNYSILTYFMDIFISVFAVVVPAFFYIKLSRNSLNDIISTKYVKQKSMIPILFLGMGGAMIANVATSVIADNFSLFGIENTSSGLTIGDSSVLSIVLNIISTAIVPAFAEEFAFRGIVMGSLRNNSSYRLCNFVRCNASEYITNSVCVYSRTYFCVCRLQIQFYSSVNCNPFS